MSAGVAVCIYCGRSRGRCTCQRPAFYEDRDAYAEAAALSGRDSLDLARELAKLDRVTRRPEAVR